MFIIWAQVALKSEKAAREARERMLATGDTSLQLEETEATLITLVSVASSFEALRHEISHNVSPSPLATWEAERRGSADKDVLATLRLAFALPDKEWEKRLKWLFDLRNKAVHPKWKSGGTLPHPSGLHSTTQEFVEFSCEQGSKAADLLLDLLGDCLSNPVPDLAEWATGVTPAYEETRVFRGKE